MSYMDRPYELRDQVSDYDDPDLLYHRDEKIDDYTRLMEAEFLKEQFAADRMMDLNSRHDRGEVTDLEYGLEEDLIRAESDVQAIARIEEVEGTSTLEDLETAENPEGPWEHEAAVRDWIAEIGPNGAAEQILELSQQDRISPEDYDRIVDLIHEARHGQDEGPDPAE